MRILTITLAGMGNAIMFGPTLRALRERYPEAEITLLVRLSISAIPFENLGIVDRIEVCPKSSLKMLWLLWKLRRKKFDVSITAFPSNRYQYNILAFLIKAKQRITHSYRVGRIRTLSFLQNKKVPAGNQLHDVEQNLNLLTALDVEPNKVERSLFFNITEQDRQGASFFLRANGIKRTDRLVGLHLSIDHQKPYKMWDKNTIRIFGETGDYIAQKYMAKVICFAGPGEEKIATSLAKQIGSTAIVVTGIPLIIMATLIDGCSLLIDTDSGLGHIAAAVGTPSLTVFSCGNPLRTKPYGLQAHILPRKNPCLYCWDYPLRATNTKVQCHRGYDCSGGLKSSEIVSAIDNILGEGKIEGTRYRMLV